MRSLPIRTGYTETRGDTEQRPRRMTAVIIRTVSAFAIVLAIAMVLMPLAQGQASSDQTKGNYVIGSQDVLSISVWDQPDLSGKFTVEADGSFTFPLIGRIMAGGLTLRDLESELRKRLADGYFKNPQVSVSIEQYRSQRIFVIGEVRSPGAYPLTGDMTLIEALARAGSTTMEAGGEAVIVRPPAGKAAIAPLLPNQEDASEVVRVNIRDLQDGQRSQNIALQDGDTIFVPRAETIYVFGQVKNPGAYPLKSMDTTVLQALSLAGGVTDRGSTNRIKIVRIIDGKKVELKAKLGDPVKPGDTIIVRERFF
jgi:polysaccharide biosynthesis/export protein